MKRIVIMPYKMSSTSGKALSRHFKTKRIYPNNNYVPRNGDVVVNWGFRGNSQVIQRNDIDFTVLNPPENVEVASNKIKALTKLSNEGLNTLIFFTSKEDASSYLEENENSLIYCRTIVNGKAGQGIILARTKEELVDSPLYTVYFKNDREFRVHIFNNEIIDFAEKKKMSSRRKLVMNIEESEDSKYIRNLKKAWSFCRNGITLPEKIKDECIKAISCLGLNFAAVDIVYNTEFDTVSILELNTAPGMKRGTTTHFNYSNAIGKLIGKKLNEEDYNQKYNTKIGEKDIQE
jgi:hypothetical protein